MVIWVSRCASCGQYGCLVKDREMMPEGCPGLGKVVEDATKEYTGEVACIAKVSAEVEYDGYMKWTRVEELMEFCRRMGWSRVGIASCIGLRRECIILTRILESNGFDVRGVFCKVGGVPKEAIGVSREKMLSKEGDAMCNPVSQARLLDKEETDVNVILGLCVGHDILFTRFSRQPVTTLVVKDRVLCHNPVGAIYGADGMYYKRLYGNAKKTKA